MQPDPIGELNDETLAEEIKLLADLVLASSGLTRHLTPREVDQILKLDPPGCDVLPAAG